MEEIEKLEKELELSMRVKNSLEKIEEELLPLPSTVVAAILSAYMVSVELAIAVESTNGVVPDSLKRVHDLTKRHLRAVGLTL